MEIDESIFIIDSAECMNIASAGGSECTAYDVIVNAKFIETVQV